MFVKPNGEYDFQKLLEITKIVTKNLNKVIDVNYYPVKEVIKFIKFKFSCIKALKPFEIVELFSRFLTILNQHFYS